ncbi:hypothetical protein MANES_02G211201v8 [Manihot esculenta]|uniref:Uncharacterized protein n=2 Tax=Manihot esculenta TaxID=3983 RepID=A0ACB7IDJ3_MANES|nr:hypothetical protein MANES_02G211201v8 [Manihot esculenta]KAG8661152.1 hypothetical protein MANES_02G211201v8 [Manihot esculenta]
MITPNIPVSLKEKERKGRRANEKKKVNESLSLRLKIDRRRGSLLFLSCRNCGGFVLFSVSCICFICFAGSVVFDEGAILLNLDILRALIASCGNRRSCSYVR